MDSLNNGPLISKPSKSLWTYFTECYTNNYFNLKGRARRREYWGFMLFFVIISTGLRLVGTFFSLLFLGISDDPALSLTSTLGTSFVTSSLAFAFSLGSLLPLISVTVRRLHDRGMTGKWVLAQYILGFCASVSLLVLTFSLAAGGGGTYSTGVVTILNLAALVLSIYLLVQYCMDGAKEDNQYGSSPKYVPIGDYVADDSSL